MSIANAENILRVLNALNPWWRTGAVRKEMNKTYKRFAYFEACRHLLHPDIRRAVILSGARRVGKTTIQYQLIDSLLAQGLEPKKIIFLSLDHPLLKLCDLGEIFRCYQENVYGGEDVYYFLDEVQYAADWDRWIKVLYDSNPLCKIVATGSASPVLVKKSSESGAGRWTVIQVPTLSFYEYCELLDIPGRPRLPGEMRPTGLSKLNKRELNALFAKLAGLQRHFHRYLQVGGFPELALSGDEFMAQHIMREDVVDKVIKRDIPSLYNIRNSTELERIFLYLCFCSANIIATDAIAKELGGVTRHTVDGYINFLESANLIYRSYPINLSGKKALKARPKIYIADAAIRNAVLMQENILTDPVAMGIMVETSIYKHVAAFYYQNTAQVGYWRDSATQKEIDVVVEFPAGKILIEVKYREDTSIAAKDAVYQLSRDAAAAMVITKREEDYGLFHTAAGQILKIPAFAFLYLLGNAEKHGYKGQRGL
jgi:predicted AAA+ superfamily ATPase